MRSLTTAFVVAAIAVSAVSCSSPAQPAPVTSTTPATAHLSADAEFVAQINKIKSKYPADKSAPAAVGTLPAFLAGSCQLMTSPLVASSAEWTELRTLLTKSGRCPATK